MQTTMLRRTCALLFVSAAAAGAAACSPGSLPGSPAPILTGGGGGRYDGTLSYRRLGGTTAIDESNQRMTMSLVLGSGDQFTAQFDSSSGSRGSLQGSLNGALNNGTFQATILVTVPAVGAATGFSLGPIGFRPLADAGPVCEGRGEATGSFNGLNISWTIGTITYTNCSLTTSSQANATAVSPIPQTSATTSRANVVITVFPAATLARGTCANGASGFPFTVEIAEVAGVSVTLDKTVTIEERRSDQVVAVSHEDNPLTALAAGEKRRYTGCGVAAGTYQAFFTGRDANGNTIRFSTPLITFRG
jgi:hypothetical protein